MLDFMEDLKRLLTDNIELKSLFGSFAIVAGWTFNGEYQALIAIFSLVTIDFLTGTHHAVKTNTWTSRRCREGIVKYFRYLTFMFVARMVDKVVPLPFAAPLMDSFIVINEAGSILENFDKLGHNVPLFLIEKFKSYFKDKGE